jgi:type II secretory pathway component PulF
VTIHAIAWGLLMALLGVVVPKFEAAFADFGIPLSDLSIGVIEASHIVGVLATLTLILLVADGFILELFRRRDIVKGSRGWSSLMIATPLLLAALTMVALVFPLFTLHQKLSG